jgi:DNA-binding PadR family transcriptional regulator
MVASTVVLSNEKMEGRILKKMHERIIKSFMDIIIMAELLKGPLSGYNVISYIHNKFNLLVSSGTVYSFMYSLERNGLVEGTWDERKRTYKLTDKGKKTIETILSANDKIKIFVASILNIYAAANCELSGCVCCAGSLEIAFTAFLH